MTPAPVAAVKNISTAAANKFITLVPVGKTCLKNKR